jgi:O-antigen ligase
VGIAARIDPRLPQAETEPYSRLLSWLPVFAVVALPLGVLAFFAHPKLGALALASLVAPLLVISPRHGLLLLIAALPIDAVGSLGPPGTATITRLLGVGVMAGWVLHVLLRRERVVLGRPGGLLLAYLAFAASSLLWAEDRAAAFATLELLVQLFVLYLMVVNLLPSWDAIRRALDVLLVSTTVVALFVFWQLPGLDGPRATLQLGDEAFNPNQLAAGLVLPVFAGVALGGSSSRWWRAAAVVPLVVAALLTGSRGATVALLAGAVALVAARPRIVARIVALGVVVALAAAVLVPADRRAMLGDRYAAIVEDRGSGRLDIWRVGTGMVADRPVIGVGLAGFQPSFYGYMDGADVDPRWAREWSNRYGQRGAHNVYLQTLAELGVAGLALLLAALGAHVAAAWREQRWAAAAREHDAAALALSLLCILTVLLALFVNGDLLAGKSAWVVLGMVQAGALAGEAARRRRRSARHAGARWRIAA